MRRYDGVVVEHNTPIDVFMSGKDIAVKVGHTTSFITMNFPPAVLMKLVMLAEGVLAEEAMDRLCPADTLDGHPTLIDHERARTA